MVSQPEAALAHLVIERPAKYRDRAVRYRITIDGAAIEPTLQPNAVVTTTVEVGRHRLAVSKVGSDRQFVVELKIADGSKRQFQVVPGGWFAMRPPIVLESGVQLSGTTTGT